MKCAKETQINKQKLYKIINEFFTYATWIILNMRELVYSCKELMSQRTKKYIFNRDFEKISACL